MKLAIVGPDPTILTIKGLKELDHEVWAEVSLNEGADRYYAEEFNPYPKNCSVTKMLFQAYEEGFKDVVVLGFDRNNNFVKELSYTIGFLNAKGMNIKWEGIYDCWRYTTKIQKDG